MSESTKELAVEYQNILAILVAALFDRWNLSPSERRGLLGDIDPENFCLHEKDSDIVEMRMMQLLFIHRCLCRKYRNDRAMVYGWLGRPNFRFNSGRPVDELIDHGQQGFNRIIQYLTTAKGGNGKGANNVIKLRY